MLLQAAGLAVLASLSPTALLMVAVFLGSATPRLTAAFYLIGAVAMSLVMGIVILVALRSADLSRPAEEAPRYGVRLGLGTFLVAAGLIVAKRNRDRPESRRAEPGVVARMAASPAPRSAFLVGVLVFAPGAAFVAAVQVIATARASVEQTVIAIATVVVINVILVWLPIVFYILAPDKTGDRLKTFNAWLRAHGRAIVAWVLLVAGAIMAANGIYGLT